MRRSFTLLLAAAALLLSLLSVSVANAGPEDKLPRLCANIHCP